MRILQFSRMKEWYEANERRVSTGSLLLGFIIDSLTLRRIDLFRENAWILTNIIIAAVCIIIVNRLENNKTDNTGESRRHFWLTNLMQFAFGAQLGTFIIFYFRSGALSASWPFLLVLLGAVLANEFFKKHHTRLTFHASFLFLSIFTFLIFIVPILTHRIGSLVFLLSGALSLLVFGFFLRLLETISRERFLRSRKGLTMSVLGIYFGLNFLYFANVIPPIPLALKEGGVYHSVSRQAGQYVLVDEERSLISMLDPFPNIHLSPGEKAYAFSAVFSPTNLDTTIVHVWERFDETRNRWVEETSIRLPVRGGSSGGWRTFSVHANLAEGEWRVSVENLRGQVIGRMRFEVVFVTTPPVLLTKVQ